MLIPRRPDPASPNSGPLYRIAEGETDSTTITILRRILQNNDTIADFVQATASHLQRFRDFKAKILPAVLEKIWNWAKAFEQDPLCSEFLRVVRTSAPLWSSLFEASSRSNSQASTDSFVDMPNYYVITLADRLIRNRNTSSEAMALTELWISNGVFDALEASLGAVLHRGTEDEQVELCGTSSNIRMS